jgi:hypothetical protein
MKLRSFFSGLLAIVVVLLLTGAGGFYWITANSPLKLLRAGGDQTPEAAMFVPKQAPVMLSLLVNPHDLKNLRQVLAAPQRRRQARAEFVQLEQSLLANTGLNYDQDVQPWLGDEVTLAITTLDIDRDRANGKQPGYLLAIATKDPQRSREFLQVFWQKRAIAGTDLTFEQYKGVKLIYNEVREIEVGKQQADKKQQAKTAANKAPFLTSSSLPGAAFSTPALASAVVGDKFVLFANEPKVLRDAITNVQAAELNLDQAKFYTQALDTLTQARIGLSFVNLPGLAQWLETEAITPAGVASDKEKLATSPIADQTLAIALELDRRGLIAETAMTETTGQAAIAPALTKPVAALRYVPATSTFAAAGTNLNHLWQELSASLDRYKPIAKLVDQSLQNVEQRHHLNLPQDVFQWVTDDYVLATVPIQSDPSSDAQTRKNRNKQSTSQSRLANDWIFVAERGNQAIVKPAIAHLDEIAKQQGYSVGVVQLGEQTVSAWTKLTSTNPFSKTLTAEVQAVHATIGNYELFTTSLPAMEQALNATDHSLIKSDRLQQAISPFQRPNNGYLYLDWAESQAVLEQRFPFLKVLKLTGSPLFKHLQSFTISSYGRQDGIHRGAVFLKLA